MRATVDINGLVSVIDSALRASVGYNPYGNNYIAFVTSNSGAIEIKSIATDLSLSTTITPEEVEGPCDMAIVVDGARLKKMLSALASADESRIAELHLEQTLLRITGRDIDLRIEALEDSREATKRVFDIGDYVARFSASAIDFSKAITRVSSLLDRSDKSNRYGESWVDCVNLSICSDDAAVFSAGVNYRVGQFFININDLEKNGDIDVNIFDDVASSIAKIVRAMGGQLSVRLTPTSIQMSGLENSLFPYEIVTRTAAIKYPPVDYLFNNVRDLLTVEVEKAKIEPVVECLHSVSESGLDDVLVESDGRTIALRMDNVLVGGSVQMVNTGGSSKIECTRLSGINNSHKNTMIINNIKEALNIISGNVIITFTDETFIIKDTASPNRAAIAIVVKSQAGA